MNHSRLVLGLDLGVTSIGWALVRLNSDATDDGLQGSIVSAGVRIFPATTEGAKNEPKNLSRRMSRGQRRTIRRKSRRKSELRVLLTKAGLLPEIETEDSSSFNNLGDPYELRAKGISEKLSPFEIGRAIFHLSRRRGFKSNRKTESKSEDGVVLSSINLISEAIERENRRTLGAYLKSLPKKRGIYTSRAMVDDEFETIWEQQRQHHPEILTGALRSQIRSIIFFQRNVYWNKGTIGKCTFETDKRRCDIAKQPAQRVRYWQDLNNLKVQDPKSLEWSLLSIEDRRRLAVELEKFKDISFDKIRKLLKINPDSRINLEASEKKIKGNGTGVQFRKAMGKAWDALDEGRQNMLVDEFLRIENNESLIRRLSEFWQLPSEIIDRVMTIRPEVGKSRLSLKAINKILPLMMEGKRYDEACAEVYGDHRSLFNTISLEKLPNPPKDIRNPIVFKALSETKKVINAILREFGKPDQINIEMARDLKLTPKQKDALQKQQNRNKKANEEAEEFFKEKFNLDNPSGSDKLKYRLWKEAGGICPYSGKTISPDLLLTDQVDFEHIIPYSRSFDDSYMNKTICDAEFNRKVKKNATPYELFASDEERYHQVLQRVSNFPNGKRRKFELTEDEFQQTDWIGRQLSDTRYICREARAYLMQLYSKPEGQEVVVVSGGSTSNLRHVWGLNSILADDNGDEKNRNDHRHHAIDAVVIALTSRGLYQLIARLSGRNKELMKKTLSGMPSPWNDFRDEVAAVVGNIIVSHAPTHRVRGGFFDDTAFGATKVPSIFVTRKPLASLTPKMITQIADPMVKQIIEEHLTAHGGDYKAAFQQDNVVLHRDGKTPIKSVRVHFAKSPETVAGITNAAGEEYKFYALGGNHHVEIYENADGVREAVLVPRFKALQNLRKAIAEGRRPNPNSAENVDGKRLLFTFCANDYLEFIGDDGKLLVYRVQKMSGGKTARIDCRMPNYAGTDYINKIVTPAIVGSGFSRITRKLQVDPLGRLTQAND